MKNCFFLGLLAATLAAPAAAQTAPALAPPVLTHPCNAFSGRVSSGDKPLSGVSVLVKGTAVVIITNEEGFFSLPAKITEFPTLLISAAGYGPETLTLNSCAPVDVEMQLLPGTRIKQHGKRKGFIMKTGQ